MKPKNRLRIGFVLDDSLDKTDGVQQYIITLGKWLRGKGHDVHYLVGQTERDDIPHIHSLSRNLQVHFNQNRMSTPLPTSKQKIQNLIKTEKFDVLHVQLPHSPLMAGRIVKIAPKSTVIVGTFHVIPFSGVEKIGAKILGIALKRNLRKFDEVLSVSRPAAKFARYSFGLKTAILPNVVDVGFFHGARPWPKYNDGLINIVFVGRLVERKGCRNLLEALQQLHSSNKLDGVRVLVCGKGPLQRELENYVKRHHLTRVVHFTGYVSDSDKARYLKSAHLAVFPSLGGESFGIVLIEAMAAGSPVIIAGDNAGYRSVISNPKQLINPRDTKAFAKTLDHYIRNARARRLATDWQSKQIHNYDVRTVGPILLDRYYAALQRKQGMR